MSVTNYSAVSNDAKKKIASQLIKRASFQTRFYDIAQKEKIDAGHGKTIYFYKYPDLTAPYTTLTEGTDPTSQALTNSEVSATAEQWGNVIGITDVAELTINTPLMQQAMDILARQARKIVDREIQEVLKGGTNIYYANGAASRDALTTSDKIDDDDITNVVARMRDNGAEAFEGDMFMGVMDPGTEAELTKASASNGFSISTAYAGELIPLRKGEFTAWRGVRWIRTNFMPYLQRANAISASAVTSGGSVPDATYKVGLVARDVTNGQERIIYVQSADVTMSGGSGAGSITLTTPNLSSYRFDVYVGISGSTLYRFSANNAHNTAITITSIPTTVAYPVVPGASVKVHKTYIFGRGAFACADLQNLSFHITPKGPTTGNVLELARYMGFKMMFKAVILEDNYMYQIESHSDAV